jgi:hypothetical protein
MSSFDFAEFEREVKRVSGVVGAPPGLRLGKTDTELDRLEALEKKYPELEIDVLDKKCLELERVQHELTTLLNDLKTKFSVDRRTETDFAQLCVLKRKHPDPIQAKIDRARLYDMEENNKIFRAKTERYIQLNGSAGMAQHANKWYIPYNAADESSERRALMLWDTIAAIQV